MTGQTIRLHRVLRGTPDRLYRAFTDPDAMVKWLPPFGFTATMHDSDHRANALQHGGRGCGSVPRPGIAKR